MIDLLSRSLRARLFILLLPALALVAAAAVYWRYEAALSTAEKLYDKTLLAVTLAISRHVVSSGGDLVAEDILEIVTRFLGDQVFYKVTGPKGSFVTGYADGPKIPTGIKPEPGKPAFFDAVYQGDNVRVTVYKEFNDQDDIKGWVTVKVWQTTHERVAFARQLVGQFLMLIAFFLLLAAAIIWFGIRAGLAPLLSLVESVSRRSAEDLSPIRRKVPKEVTSLVASVNALFEKLRASFAARDAFIANAAHQLRNPIAAVLAQAEAAEKTDDPAEARQRLATVAEAARRTSRLSQQLLSLEKAKGYGAVTEFDVAGLAEDISRRRAPEVIRAGATFEFDRAGKPVVVRGDETMIGEAIENLVDNAIRYGMENEGKIMVQTKTDQDRWAVISVEDDGPGIPVDYRASIFDRFTRGPDDSSNGCGLGLAIVSEVAKLHNGKIELVNGDSTRFIMRLPLAYGQSAAAS